MTTPLDSVLKRELTIGGELYTLTISPEGFSLTVKGRRNGLDIAWADLVGGDAALATALNASLTANFEPSATSAGAPKLKIRSAAAEKVRAPRASAAKSVEPPAAAGPSRRSKASLKLVEPSNKKPAAKRKRK
jgi:hypothetical protein